MALADEDSPAFVAGVFELIAAAYFDEPKVKEAFRTGEGVGWHEHHACLFRGIERFFRSGYSAFLVQDWIPALDGVKAKLERGARVADVGCGHGASTILMAKAFPKARSSASTITSRRSSAPARRPQPRRRGNATFEVATAKNFPGRDYDLVACFDCLHDMGDPEGAAAHVRSSLARRHLHARRAVRAG